MKHLLIVILVLLVAGCAEMRSPISGAPDYSAWDVRQQALNRLQTWDLTARLAIKTEKEGWNANMHWNQRPDAWQMRVSGPFNQGTFQLQGNAEKVLLQTPDNKMFRANTPEALMQYHLGWSVPIDGLKYWVRGVPEPDVNVDNLVIDGSGHMTELQQAGWNITISRYGNSENMELPTKLEMKNDRFQLRLVVQEWEHLN